MSLFLTLIHRVGTACQTLRSRCAQTYGGTYSASESDELPEPTTPEQSRYLQAAIEREEGMRREEMIAAEKSNTDERQIEARMGIYAPDVCFSDGRAGNWILAERDAVINVEDHQ